MFCPPFLLRMRGAGFSLQCMGFRLDYTSKPLSNDQVRIGKASVYSVNKHFRTTVGQILC